MLRRPVFALAALVFAAAALHAAGPQFWRLEGARAFLEGDIEGLSLDSDGRLRLGASPRPLFDPEAPNAWCVARDSRGVLYVGTGNDGRVLRVDGTKGSVLFDAEELEVHAVAVGPDGRVYAATSPDGAVYAIDAAGKATRFFDPPETYVWALAFDPKGALYVATGGEGRVHRVSADGKSETVAHLHRDAHPLARRRRPRPRLRRQRPRGPRLPHRRPRQGVRPPRLRVSRDQGARRGRGRQPVRGGHRRADDRVPGEADPRALRLRGRRGGGDGQRELRGGPGLGRRPGHRGTRRRRTRRRSRRRALCSASAPRARSTPCGARPTTFPTPWSAPAPTSSSARGTRARSTASATTAGGRSSRRCPRSRSRRSRAPPPGVWPS